MKRIPIQDFYKSICSLIIFFVIEIYASELAVGGLAPEDCRTQMERLNYEHINNVKILYNQVLSALKIDTNDAPALTYQDIEAGDEHWRKLAAYSTEKINGNWSKRSIFFNMFLMRELPGHQNEYKVRSEAEIKAILTHEIGHFLQRRDEAAVMDKECRWNKLLDYWNPTLPFVALFSAVYLGYKYELKNNFFLASIILFPSMLILMMQRERCSADRAREIRCDLLAAQHFPDGMINFLSKVDQRDRKHRYCYLQCKFGFDQHPTGAQRIAAIQSYLDEQKNKK